MPDNAREFLWVEELFDEKMKSPEILLPFNKSALKDVLQSLKDTLHNNFVASVLSVGRFNSTYLLSVFKNNKCICVTVMIRFSARGEYLVLTPQGRALNYSGQAAYIFL